MLCCEYHEDWVFNKLNSVNIFNECKDSLLTTLLILDLTILAELFTWINYRELSNGTDTEFNPLPPVLSLLLYMLKAPLVKPGAYIILCCRSDG